MLWRCGAIRSDDVHLVEIGFLRRFQVNPMSVRQDTVYYTGEFGVKRVSLGESVY